MEEPNFVDKNMSNASVSGIKDSFVLGYVFVGFESQWSSQGIVGRIES